MSAELNQQSFFEIKESESEKMKSFKKVEYELPDIGKVVEELQIELMKFYKNGQKGEQKAIHKVYINDELVREHNLIDDIILKSDPKYEPWNFLHIDQSTYQQMRDNALTF